MKPKTMRPMPSGGDAAREDFAAWCREIEHESHLPAAQRAIQEALAAGLVYVFPSEEDRTRVRVLPASVAKNR
jgi:hypothetical protein